MHVDLVPKRRQDRDYRHYDIFAGEQLVGVIYHHLPSSIREVWFWGINTVTLDGTVGAPMHGYAGSFEQARDAFRRAFDVWLAWAVAVPRWDMKRAEIDENLRAIGFI